MPIGEHAIEHLPGTAGGAAAVTLDQMRSLGLPLFAEAGKIRSLDLKRQLAAVGLLGTALQQQYAGLLVSAMVQLQGRAGGVAQQDGQGECFGEETASGIEVAHFKDGWVPGSALNLGVASWRVGK